MSRRSRQSDQYAPYASEHKGDQEFTTPPHQATNGNTNSKGNSKNERLPIHRDANEKTAGESGRSGFQPLHFFRITFRSTSRLSTAVNVLWPVVPAAIAVHFALPDHHPLIFVLNYIAMVPAANTVGFAGHELARMMPKVMGVLVEVTLGSVVEVILFIALLVIGKQKALAKGMAQGAGLDGRNLNIGVIKAAILGSILANLLLCLGLCFIAGGIGRREQKFHDAVSEVDTGLMFLAAIALIIPCVFSTSLGNRAINTSGVHVNDEIEKKILQISRGTAVLLWITFFVYLFYNLRSHHTIFDTVLEQDELADRDKAKDSAKKKLTLTESLVTLAVPLCCVAMIAVFLVPKIEYIVAPRGVPDTFMGLILVPLVEKAAEHLTAVDAAFDNKPNLALSHVLGGTVQTALLSAPLVVLVGWGLAQPMDLDFLQFQAVVLVLAVLAVGNFLRDGKSNYLEGALCVCIYVLVALAAFYYPNPAEPAQGVEQCDLRRDQWQQVKMSVLPLLQPLSRKPCGVGTCIDSARIECLVVIVHQHCPVGVGVLRFVIELATVAPTV